MNRFFSKFPWLRPLGCGLLVCALVLSICLPLLGMRAAEPDNPILQAEPQEITVLQAGNAPGHSGSGDGLNASGSGANGDTESDLTGEAEQPNPEGADSEAGQSTEPEPAPQEQPAQPDYSDLDIGTNADSNSGSEGEEPGDTGETDESLPLPDLDLGATLTWYKYGAQPAAIACTPGETVGKRILLSQLNNGMLPYDLRLTGLNAPDARITGAFFAAGNGVPSPIDPSGSVVMTLPDGAEFQNYVFLLQAHVTQKTANGEPVETDVEFTFLLRLESGLDLDLRLAWQTTSSPAEATCGANNTTTRTVKSDTLTDGLFQYSFDFLGESAHTAEFVSADYRAGDGETGTLSQSGVLQMSPADGQDQETYFLSVTARASGQTVRYSFVLTYEDGLDLQLKFSWLERSVTRRDTLCAANGGASLTIKHNQLKDGLLQYQLALTGRSADKAAITSATLNSDALSTDAGSIQLQSAEGGASYTIVVTAESGGKTITFKLLLRYQSDVSLKMTYSVLENDIERPRQLTCENGRTFTADVIRDDQLADGLLTYQFSIEGEEASDAIITNVEFLNGRGRSTSSTPSSPTASGTAALTLGHDNKTTGNNTFTVTAKQGDTTYQFTGYDRFVDEGKIVAIVAEDELRDAVTEGTDAILVLDQTPFYAEMGGQTADHGVICTLEAEFTVLDVQKNKGGKFMHYGKVTRGSFAVGDTVEARVDETRRRAIMRAHSATHLLDQALRTVLGDHAHQAGSLVEEDRLRYDFTHFSAVTAEELREVSRLVSEQILAGLDVDVREMPIEEAKKAGAIALFGEKYGDVVRVVNMGGWSVELCGGTHVDNTAKIGPFRITSETSVASGVRRIEAVTGQVFLDQVDEMNARLVRAAEVLKTTPGELLAKAESSMREIKELHQAIEKLKDRMFSSDVDSMLFSGKSVSGLKVVTVSRENMEANDLRKLGDFLRDRNPDTVAVLSTVNGEKVTLLAVCGKNAIAHGIKAGDIIRSIAPIVGGKGGGKPDSAMGGGTDVLKVDDALAAVDDFVAANVKE